MGIQDEGISKIEGGKRPEGGTERFEELSKKGAEVKVEVTKLEQAGTPTEQLEEMAGNTGTEDSMS